MMFHYPYWGYPFSSRYSRYGYRYPNYGYSPSYQTSYHSKQNKVASTKEKEKIPSVTPPKEDTKSSCSEEEPPIFEIFGIKLYFDDILLVCLIFFLYQEGVKDQSLFISLILLLLS